LKAILHYNFFDVGWYHRYVPPLSYNGDGCKARAKAQEISARAAMISPLGANAESSPLSDSFHINIAYFNVVKLMSSQAASV